LNWLGYQTCFPKESFANFAFFAPLR